MNYESPVDTFKKSGEALSAPLKKESIKALSDLRLELAQKTTEWHQLLSETKNRLLHPKDKDLTELDRQVMLKAHSAVVRKDYELLCRLEELTKDRIELIKFVIK